MIWFFDRRDGALISAIQTDSTVPYDGSSHHTDAAPPSCAAGYWPQWTGSGWVCAIDHRGTTWHLPGTQQIATIFLVGEEPAAGWIEGLPAPATPPSGPTIDL